VRARAVKNDKNLLAVSKQMVTLQCESNAKDGGFASARYGPSGVNSSHRVRGDKSAAVRSQGKIEKGCEGSKEHWAGIRRCFQNHDNSEAEKIQKAVDLAKDSGCRLWCGRFAYDGGRERSRTSLDLPDGNWNWLRRSMRRVTGGGVRKMGDRGASTG